MPWHYAYAGTASVRDHAASLTLHGSLLCGRLLQSDRVSVVQVGGSEAQPTVMLDGERQRPAVWCPSCPADEKTPARLLCAACQVRGECADYARRVRLPEGVWGGEARGDRTPRLANSKRRVSA